MIVFRYDKTFEGLLTAVFDAYSRRSFPERLIGPGEPEPMFTQEMFRSVTDPARAERVWKGLCGKLPRRARNMIVHVWLSETPGCDELLMRYIRKAFDRGAAATGDFTDPDVLAVRERALFVSREAERVRQFARLRKMADGTYYAPVSPKCNALPLTVEYFRDRFADQKWLLYDPKRRYGYCYDLEQVHEVAFPDPGEGPPETLGSELLDRDERQFQKLWKSYFDALAIRERANPRLQRQHMPVRFWKYLIEK